MHPVQKHILYHLIKNKSLPFSKLKPNNTESNLFLYHLNKLISDEVIEKSDRGYRLTRKGLSFVDKLSLATFQPRIQPNIVTILVVENDKGEHLIYKRSRQPFLGFMGFPYGKIHLGEKILQAANRELMEKTGLSADLKHKGDIYLTTYQGEELYTQLFCHIFTGNNPEGNLKEKADFGECFWQKIDLKDLGSEKYIPGVKDIYVTLQKAPKEIFFSEFTYHL